MNGAIEIRGSLLARNTVLNFVGQAVPLMVGVVTIPLIIRGLGTERFGILSLAWIVLGYFSLFDLGLGRATTKFVAEYLGRGETDRLARLVWTSVALQGLLGVVGGLALATLVPLLVDKVLNIPPQFVAETKGAFYLLALSIPVVILSASVRGVLEAGQRFDLVNAVQVPASAATFLLPVVALSFGADLFGIVVLLVTSRLVALLAYLALCFRAFPTLKRSFSIHLELVRPLFAYGGWITVSNVVGPILSYFDRFLIGSLLSMAAVAYYTAPLEVITRLWIIPSSLVMTLFPAFSTLGTTRKEDLRRLYARSIKYLLLLTGPIVLLLVIFADNVLQLWLGPGFAQQSTLTFQILLLGALIGLLAPVSGCLLQSLGRPDILSKLYLLYLPLNIGLVWLLVDNMGIVGAALSFALRALVDTVLLFIISSRLIHLPYASFAENGLRRSVGFLLGFAGALWVASLIRVFPVQVGLVVIAILVFIMVTWHYVLDQMDKMVIISAMGKWSVLERP